MMSKGNFELLLSDFRGAVEHSIHNSEQNAWLRGILNMISSRMYMMTMYEDLLIQSKYFNGSKILDFGTGSGICAFLLSKIGFNVVGIDIVNFQDEMPSHATMKYEQEVLWTELMKKSPSLSFLHYSGSIPYNDGHFSDVVAYAVLEHIPDSQVSFALNEIKRVMHNKGALFGSRLPRRYSYAEWLARLFRMGCHDRLYTKYEINLLMQESGFKMILHEETDMFPSYPASFTNPIFPILVPIEKVLLKTPFRGLSHHQRFVCVCDTWADLK